MRTILIAIAALGMAGCLVGDVGDDDGGQNPGQPGEPGEPGAENAKADFDTNVLPIMRGCAGAPGACHVGAQDFPPAFLGAGPEDGYYDALVADTVVTGGFQAESARLLLKLEAGPHQNLTYTPDEVTAITNWLQAELTARNPGVDPGEIPPAPAVNLLAEFAGCMNIEDWNAANMGAWAQKATADGGCANCHVGGLSRFFANNDSLLMFEANRYEIFISGFFAIGVDGLGNPAIVPAYDRLVYIGSGNNLLHPNFNTNTEQDIYFQSLQQFVDLTNARKGVAGGCGPAEFPTGPLVPPQQ